MSSFQTGFCNLAIGTCSSVFSHLLCCSVNSREEKQARICHFSYFCSQPEPGSLTSCISGFMAHPDQTFMAMPHKNAAPYLHSFLAYFIQTPWLRYIHLFSVCLYEGRVFFFFFLLNSGLFSAPEIVTSTQEPSATVWRTDKPKGHSLPKNVYVHMFPWSHACMLLGFTANQWIRLARRSQALWGSIPPQCSRQLQSHLPFLC